MPKTRGGETAKRDVMWSPKSSSGGGGRGVAGDDRSSRDGLGGSAEEELKWNVEDELDRE